MRHFVDVHIEREVDINGALPGIDAAAAGAYGGDGACVYLEQRGNVLTQPLFAARHIRRDAGGYVMKHYDEF